jgi:hypothetical protein
MVSIFPSKDIDWKSGLKNKAWLPVACKRYNSLAKTILEWKDGKRLLSKWSPNQTGVAILISDKVVLRPKLVRRDKEGHMILSKGTIEQEEIAIVHIYSLTISPPNFIKWSLLDIKTQIPTQ